MYVLSKPNHFNSPILFSIMQLQCEFCMEKHCKYIRKITKLNWDCYKISKNMDSLVLILLAYKLSLTKRKYSRNENDDSEVINNKQKWV